MNSRRLISTSFRELWRQLVIVILLIAASVLAQRCCLLMVQKFIGANQENAAFPSGLCAERSAIFAAQSVYPDQAVTTLAIAAANEYGLMRDPIVPCGACRQVILEIEDRYKQPIRILLYGTAGIYVINSVKDLLPLQFLGESMK